MNDCSHTVKDAPRQIIATGHVPLLRFATRCSTYCIRRPRQQPQRLTLLFQRRAKRGAHIASGARQQYQRPGPRLELLKPDNTAILLHCRRADSLHDRQLTNMLKWTTHRPGFDDTVYLGKTCTLQAIYRYFDASKVMLTGSDAQLTKELKLRSKL